MIRGQSLWMTTQASNKLMKTMVPRLLLGVLLTIFLLYESVAALSPSSPTTQPILQILGLGQVGCAVAAAAVGSHTVYGTVREAEDVGGDNLPGLKKVLFCRETLEALFPSCSCVLVTIPPSKADSKDRATQEILYDNMVNLLPDRSWIGIISTTGVYGHHDGDWVDEESALLGLGDSASRFQAFEAHWRARLLECGSNHTLHIFRCAGIYGPDRSALHTLYKRGLPLQSGKGGITNRIHVEDVAKAAVAAMSSTREEANDSVVRVYNLADDLPESRDVVMQYAADIFASINVSLQAKHPSRDAPPSSDRASRRNRELKLVSNKRMKSELLPENGLMYPTYEEGLKEILALPDQPWS